ncbi:MAG: SDR family oxidoreductase [Thermoguttaceae bacterium]|jgi:NADP-dependent 3-hydroxy acid dehydrogenase YdfG
MADPLDKKVVVVTGASAGMGEAIARRFAAAGAKVVLSARRIDRLEKLAREIAAAGGQAKVVPADVARFDQVQNLIDTAVRDWGRIDILVNNAGYGKLGPFVENSRADIDGQIDVNFKGVCYGCRAALPHMIRRKSGQIITIGSIGSVKPFPSLAVYVGAKFAVYGFIRSVYEEVRQYGIRMNLICPAATNTEWLDVAGFKSPPWKPQDMLQAEDVAEMAYHCAAMPERVQIESIIAWPVCQATT